MTMEVAQARLPDGLMKKVDSLVERGEYSNRSDVIRDAVRRFVWEKEAGTISKKGSSAELVRKARERLSKEKIDLEEINSL